MGVGAVVDVCERGRGMWSRCGGDWSFLLTLIHPSSLTPPFAPETVSVDMRIKRMT